MRSPGPPIIRDYYHLKVAWALMRILRHDGRFIRYTPHEQAEVIWFFEYVDHQPTGLDVQKAKGILAGAA